MMNSRQDHTRALRPYHFALHLSGPLLHPGGAIFFGGRIVAMKMMMDWEMDLNLNLKKIFAVV